MRLTRAAASTCRYPPIRKAQPPRSRPAPSVAATVGGSARGVDCFGVYQERFCGVLCPITPRSGCRHALGARLSTASCRANARPG